MALVPEAILEKLEPMLYVGMAPTRPLALTYKTARNSSTQQLDAFVDT